MCVALTPLQEYFSQWHTLYLLVDGLPVCPYWCTYSKETDVLIKCFLLSFQAHHNIRAWVVYFHDISATQQYQFSGFFSNAGPSFVNEWDLATLVFLILSGKGQKYSKWNVSQTDWTVDYSGISLFGSIVFSKTKYHIRLQINWPVNQQKINTFSH